MNQLIIDVGLDSTNEKEITIKNQGIGQEEKKATYRGFNSIDQEMERRIALQWFSSSRSGSLYGQIAIKGHL